MEDDRVRKRQAEVLGLIARGRSNKEIAAELTLSDSTVERHAANTFARIGVHNRVEAASYATRNGLE